MMEIASIDAIVVDEKCDNSDANSGSERATKAPKNEAPDIAN